MADPMAATVTQLRNIQARTGRSIAELLAAMAASGKLKHGECRAWLMEQFQLGYGDANTVVHFRDKTLPDLGVGTAPAARPPTGDPLDSLYAGTKAPLRPLHEAVLAAVHGFGPFEQAPKKSYVSLRRARQFAMLGPATKDSVEIGLNCKTLPPHPRLKPMPPGGMCQATTRIGLADGVDADLVGWLRLAYDAAA